MFNDKLELVCILQSLSVWCNAEVKRLYGCKAKVGTCTPHSWAYENTCTIKTYVKLTWDYETYFCDVTSCVTDVI